MSAAVSSLARLYYDAFRQTSISHSDHRLERAFLQARGTRSESRFARGGGIARRRDKVRVLMEKLSGPQILRDFCKAEKGC